MLSLIQKQIQQSCCTSTMRDIFPGYYKRDEKELSELWRSGQIILDTNVLLNLYKYQSGVQKEMLKTLSAVKDRLWLPHQVALEYQRNRLEIIGEQFEKFDKVANIVKSSRANLRSQLENLQLVKLHSTIDPSGLLDGIDKLTDDFVANLEQQKESQPRVHMDDTLREQIDDLYIGRIGNGPTDQREIDDWNQEAERRFSLEIPPGFADVKDKSKGGVPESYTFDGLQYQKKYGDLFIWKQLLAHVSECPGLGVIFVTDDSKPDWWNEVKSNGKFKVGVHPQLVEEYRRSQTAVCSTCTVVQLSWNMQRTPKYQA